MTAKLTAREIVDFVLPLTAPSAELLARAGPMVLAIFRRNGAAVPDDMLAPMMAGLSRDEQLLSQLLVELATDNDVPDADVLTAYFDRKKEEGHV